MTKRFSLLAIAVGVALVFGACESDYTNDTVEGDVSYVMEGHGLPPMCSTTGDATDLYPCGPYGTLMGLTFPNEKVALSHYHSLEGDLTAGDADVYDLMTLRAKLLEKGYKNLAILLVATWCPHCQAETRVLSQIIDDHDDTFFLSVIVSTPEGNQPGLNTSPADAQSWANMFHLSDTENYLVTWDPDHRYYFDYLKGGFPTNYFIDLKTMEILSLPAAMEDTTSWENALSVFEE